jgi:hypothetical protein
MELEFAHSRDQARLLLDAVPEDKLPTVVGLLEEMVGPLSNSAAPMKAVDLPLLAKIEHAEKMLDQSSDDEDAPGYSRTALNRARVFLTAQSAQLRKVYGVFAPVPDLGSGPNASIDLHWKRKDWELLVNIPASGNEPATFYGDNYGLQKIKGSFDPITFNHGVIAWLMGN